MLIVKPSRGVLRRGQKLGSHGENSSSSEGKIYVILVIIRLLLPLGRLALLALSVAVAVRLSVSALRENLESIEGDFRHVALLSVLVRPASVRGVPARDGEAPFPACPAPRRT